MTRYLSAILFLMDHPGAKPGCCALAVQDSTAVLTQEPLHFSQPITYCTLPKRMLLSGWIIQSSQKKCHLGATPCITGCTAVFHMLRASCHLQWLVCTCMKQLATVAQHRNTHTESGCYRCYSAHSPESAVSRQHICPLEYHSARHPSTAQP